MVKMELVGITYNQIESGVYAIILQESEGERRIPIIVGFPEAQSIECKLQGLITQRPLTHDLMVSILDTFGMKINRVQIYRMPDGVFAADIVIIDRDNCMLKVDARSSDAIALAIRVGAPIYADRKLVDECGFVPGEKPRSRVKHRSSANPKRNEAEVTIKQPTTNEYSSLSTPELEQLMQKAAENEDYEKAAKLKKELEQRNKI